MADLSRLQQLLIPGASPPLSPLPPTDPMSKSTLPLGPYWKQDKNGRPIFFIDRKRCSKEAFWIAQEDAASLASLEKSRGQSLDQLLADIKALQTPKVTPLEARLLALACVEETGSFAGYAEALSLCSQNPMSANALIGSLARKGLIFYESKQESHQRVGGLLTSQAVQDARTIQPSALGMDLGRKQLEADLALI